MSFINENCEPLADVPVRGLSALLWNVSRLLFGDGAGGLRPPTQCRVAARWERQNDDLGWLSLTQDADGHGRHQDDVLCLSVVPDDLDVHDADGGDLSWIGLNPVPCRQPVS